MFRRHYNSVAFKMTTAVLLFSLVLTIVSAVGFYAINYHDAMDKVELDLRQLEKTSVPGLSASLWVMDTQQLQIQLNSLLNIPHISEVKIESNGQIIVSAGTARPDSTSRRVFPLNYIFENRAMPLGTLQLQVSYADIYKELIERTYTKFLFQIGQIAFVALFMLYMFRCVVTRRLSTIHDQITDLESGRLDVHLIPPKPLFFRGKDELDILVQSFNSMLDRIEHGISERKRYEEVITNSNKLLQTIINNAPMRIFWKDAELRYLGCNKLFAADAGVGNPDDLIGTDDYQLTWKDQAELYRADDMRVIESGISKLSYEEPQTKQDGSLLWILTSKVPLYNEAKEIVGVLGMYEDITKRKLEEEEKLALEQQLHQAQKMESLGVLAGGIAHDFNNILAVIICNCSLAMQRPETAEKLIPEIETAAQRAAGLCRQMLAYAGKTQFVAANVDVTALVDDMLSMLKSTLPQNVTIKPYLTGDIPSIKADASQIRQIVMNLLINASEAIGDEQGDIKVALTKTTIGTEQLALDHLGKAITPGHYLCLEVTDTGCGMDDQTKQRLFEPFFTTKFTGRGLGMSAVLGIVTSHKGALQLYSQPGQGTTFKVYLPAQINDSAGEEATRHIAATPWCGSGTILLVEDEPQLVAVARSLLETMGFSVIEASNGIEALERYRKNAAAIRVVVTDIGMPQMGGYELIAELNMLNPELPVIVSSGFGDADVTSKITPGVIAGLISKPYNFDQLREVLKVVVEKTPANPRGIQPSSGPGR